MEENLHAPDGRRSGKIRTAVALGIFAAGLVAGGIVAGLNVAGAQTATPSPDATQTTKFLAHGGGFRHGGLGMGAIHGEFTTRAPGGGYQTLATQIGEVTSVSASSITVKSEDDFSRTYTVNDNTLVNAGNDGIDDVKTGDTVRITAIVDDGRARAVDIVDVTTVGELRGRWMPPRPALPSEEATATPTA